MKKNLLFLGALMLSGLSTWAQTVGDVITVNGTKYDVVGDNLFTNGSFDDAVDGWKTVGYTTDAKAENFTISTEGGWDNGAFITTNAAGVGSEKTIRQSLAVESGKTYYFCCYTSGKAPSSNNYNYNALFKMKNATTEDGVLKAFEWPQGAEQTTTDWSKTEFVFTADDAHPYAGVRMGWNASSSFDGFVICEVEQQFDLTAWNNAKEEAQTALDSYDEKYATAERDAVVEAMNVADPTTVAESNEKIATLQAAVTAYKAKAENEILVESKASLTDFINGISETYPNSTTAIFPSDLTKWTNSSYVANNGSEHWSGVKTNYYEQTGSQWGQSSWSISAEKTANLPVGKYAFVVTARAATGVTSTMTVDGQEVTLAHVGATGYGVTTDGTASYDMNDTYATTTGRGWEYAYAEFEVTEAKDVTISFSASAATTQQWVSISNPVLYYDNTAKESMELIAAKAALKSAIDAAPAVPTDHISPAPFDYNELETEYLSGSLEIAKSMYEGNESTVNEIEEMTAVVKSLRTPSLNAPSPAQAYKLILKYNGWTCDNCAITTEAGARTDAGNYNVQYIAQNDNYAQALYFTQVEGGYNLSWTDADGATRYLCTGTPYGGNNYQIRTTTTADDAMVITLSRNGEYINLYNVAAGAYIGSQDAGVYTVNSHNDFEPVETTAEHEVTVNMENRYATVCLPYSAEATACKAYAISGVGENGTELTMSEVTTLEANKAYIIYGTADVTFAGVNVAYKEPVAANENPTMTGVYTEQAATAGTYVLQKQGEAIPYFYLVSDEDGAAIPTIKANRAYVTYASVEDPGARYLTLGGNIETAINAINALTSGKADIYDLSGRRLSGLQKGMNIVNGQKVLVK